MNQAVTAKRAALHLLLPGALLAGSYALQNHPLLATTTTTALGGLGLLDQWSDPKDGKRMGALGLGLLLSTAPLSIYRAWQTVGLDRMVNLLNGGVGGGAAILALHLNSEHNLEAKTIYCSFLPAICFGIYKADLLPSHFAIAGLGVAAWYHPHTSLKYDPYQKCAIALARGTSLAALSLALLRTLQSDKWSDRLLFGQVALFHAIPLLDHFIKARIEVAEEVKKRLNAYEPRELLDALVHLLLPSLILLEAAAFQDYPLTAMAATTGLALLAIGHHPLPDNPAIPTAMSAIFSVAGVALYRSWSSWSDKGLALFANSSLALITAALGATYAWMGCKLAHQMHKEGAFEDQRAKTATLSHLLRLLFPMLCFAIHKIAPPAYGSVGVGAASLGALLLSNRYNPASDELHIQPLALGTALAALPLALNGLIQTGSWSDRLLFGGGALLQVGSFALLANEIRKGVNHVISMHS